MIVVRELEEEIKMSLQDKIKSAFDEVIVFLKGEESSEKPQQPLYTKEELKELYSIRKDIEKYPRKSED